MLLSFVCQCFNLQNCLKLDRKSKCGLTREKLKSLTKYRKQKKFTIFETVWLRAFYRLPTIASVVFETLCKVNFKKNRDFTSIVIQNVILNFKFACVFPPFYPKALPNSIVWIGIK